MELLVKYKQCGQSPSVEQEAIHIDVPHSTFTRIYFFLYVTQSVFVYFSQMWAIFLYSLTIRSNNRQWGHIAVTD